MAAVAVVDGDVAAQLRSILLHPRSLLPERSHSSWVGLAVNAKVGNVTTIQKAFGQMPILSKVLSSPNHHCKQCVVICT